MKKCCVICYNFRYTFVPYYSVPGEGAEYFDDYVSVCLSVCLFLVATRISGIACPNFLFLLAMAMALSCSCGFAIS